jgi:hypothetical protein
MFSSCAIHKEFPYICLLPSCFLGQFDMKPLKKRIQIAIKGKKRKLNASISGSQNKRIKSNYASTYNSKKTFFTDTTVKDSTVVKRIDVSLAITDTVIRIYYLDLSDTTLIRNKKLIKSYISRIGINKITEVSLSDFYTLEDPDDHKSESIKSTIGKYLVDIGVSKHRLFWRKNKRLKSKELNHKPKNLLYLEIRFN